VPDLAALKSAARAAIVIPAVFALADKVIARPQTSLIAAFGSFALLVFVDFGGPARRRLAAYVGVGCVGALLITLGTLCSRSPWLAAGVMAVVGFVVLFAGILSGYFAAAATGAILTFVLPVTIPAPNSALPDRLEAGALPSAPAWRRSCSVPPPHIRDGEGRSRLLKCIRAAAADKSTVHAALVLLWASQHLDNLWRLEEHLGDRAR
jgi:hypothetical protein